MHCKQPFYQVSIIKIMLTVISFTHSINIPLDLECFLQFFEDKTHDISKLGNASYTQRRTSHLHDNMGKETPFNN
jgi:hypothetical protein